MTGPAVTPELPHITSDSVISLVPLSVVEHGDGFIVGNAAIGRFVEVPDIAVSVIERLRNGTTIEALAHDLQRETGTDVEVLAFVRTLLRLGFVHSVNGSPLQAIAGTGDSPTARQPRWIRGPSAAAVGWLFGRTAWTAYTIAFVASAVALIAHPPYRIHADAFFFLADPVLSMAILTPIGFVTVAGHEAFHWLAACREGVAARFAISRRLYFLVAETDLTQLWSVPRKRRYGPLLAGMAFDSVLLATSLAGRALIDAGLIPAAAPAGPFLGAFGAMVMMSLAWQFLVFMRNDLYAVMVNALGCANLWRVTMLRLRRPFRLLTAAGQRELARASPRDIRAAGWYAWLCLLGVAAAAWFAEAVTLPTVWRLISSTVDTLTTFEPTSRRFWTTLLIGALALLPPLLTLAVLTRQAGRWFAAKCMRGQGRFIRSEPRQRSKVEGRG
jgi:putative peptide zinc metalloprotease protein